MAPKAEQQLMQNKVKNSAQPAPDEVDRPPMTLVISAVNIREGGTLTVLRDVVQAAATHAPRWQIYVLVHALGTVPMRGVTELEFPKSKRSWSRRLWLEWFGFKRLSRKLEPDVWLSLQDITPRVEAKRQYVYCQNPSPFCQTRIPSARFDIKFVLFRLFYGFLYGCLIQRNAAVIVQQDWLRVEFQSRYNAKRVIVAYPGIPAQHTPERPAARATPARFLYPAFPRVFKNFELLGECAVLLEQDPRWTGEILLTIDGSENRFARHIRQRYGHCRSLRFLGLQNRQGMASLYLDADALVFPSLLETWGLPLTEAKGLGLPILAADLAYAHESVGTCDRVTFFDPEDAAALAQLMLGIHTGTREFGTTESSPPAAPFANGWSELLDLLLVQDQANQVKAGRQHPPEPAP